MVNVVNNIRSFSSRSDIKQEACDWLVQIDQGTLTNTEIQEFQEWVVRGSYHLECLVKLSQLWESTGVLEEFTEIYPYISQYTESESRNLSRKKDENRLPSLKLPAFKRLRIPVLTGIGLAACFVAILLFPGPKPIDQEMFTQIGEQTSQVLQDGTVIKLNTNSHMQIKYSNSQRIIILTNGEANFDVAEDPERPFLVYAGSGLVQAVGTIFNVRYVSDVVDVTVIEGKVKVISVLGEEKIAADANRLMDTRLIPSAPKKVVHLGAGQSASYNEVIEQIETTIPAEQLTKKLAWHEGALLFQGETLQEALTEISNYTDMELIIVDDSISDFRIGGYYTVDDIDALLLTISQAFGLKAEQVSGNEMHFSSK